MNICHEWWTFSEGFDKEWNTLFTRAGSFPIILTLSSLLDQKSSGLAENALFLSLTFVSMQILNAYSKEIKQKLMDGLSLEDKQVQHLEKGVLIGPASCITGWVALRCSGISTETVLLNMITHLALDALWCFGWHKK